MSSKEMPAAEVNSYELAFHVLPTVAEGEVATVFQKLKDLITKAGGEITTEEAPARFDLAYEIIKYLEGRNRKFSSAYFGWVRFTVEPSKLEKIEDGVEGTKELLRHLIIKLTKVEEENPFFFHEALAASVKTKTVVVDEETASVEGDDEASEEDEEASETVDSEETGDEEQK